MNIWAFWITALCSAVIFEKDVARKRLLIVTFLGFAALFFFAGA